MKKNKELPKISRGYRLRRGTHSLVKNLQAITSLNSDEVISKSCMLFYKTILEQNDLVKKITINQNKLTSLEK